MSIQWLRHRRACPTRAGRADTRTAGPAESAHGFSIIELIVSLTLFSLVVGSLVTLIATGLSVARNNKDRSVAAHLASQRMDALRQESFSAITIGQSTKRTTVNSVEYRVRTNVEWVANSATSNACDSSGGSPRVLRATVTVRWTSMGTTEPVETSTEITPPVGSYDPDNGHIAVRVRDRNGGPLGGVPVRVTGPSVDETQTTVDDSGCAFFGFLSPGTYAVTLGTPGWVDRQSEAVPTQNVGVTATNVSSVAFDYDEAATLTATLTGNQGGTPPSAAPITLGNTALLPGGTKTFAGVGVLRTLASLFPFSDGYQAWSGGCADADPEGVDADGNRYWPTANREPAITVEPGAAATATIPMQTVRVEFRRDAPGSDVTIVAVHAADSSCSGGETLTLGTTPADGETLLVALPYGTWSLEALASTPHDSWESVTIDPTDTNVPDVRVRIQ